MRHSALIAVLAATLLAACSSQPPAPEQKPSQTEEHQPVAAQTAPVVQDDPYALAKLKDPKSILSKREIFFDYDQFVVRDEYRDLVAAHAKFLIANPKMGMLIQGNTDERGSREYNLALGQKRAEAVKKALTLLGAREDQVEAVSLGKEKPRCTGHDESCWSQNRRDDILYKGEY
ncbi:MAG: peptidoglycan-associated lipoprotein Pal [Proteobacteria bacterium]|nr:peptidoglycan-associated lipoprotein Pal [Pseudomonadota bacterium]HQR04832.1 peptidoglycan-associated lipoprotein Pal [Rhodocyclaceae bacterium]